jgi:hypothetical protein
VVIILAACWLHKKLPSAAEFHAKTFAGGTRNFLVFPGKEKSMIILERNAQKK